MPKQTTTLYSCDKCGRRLEGRSSGVLLPKGAMVLHGVGEPAQSLMQNLGAGADETVLCVGCLTTVIGKPPTPKREPTLP
ncbi:MAG: hypothetical protein EOO70_02320, partial [Myxococcaceae bacterium]